MVKDGNQTYCGDHFAMYRNIKPLCCVPGTNIVLQVYYTPKTKQTNSQKKRSDLWLPEAGGGQGELDEGGQKVQTSSYKINTYQGCNVQHD